MISVFFSWFLMVLFMVLDGFVLFMDLFVLLAVLTVVLFFLLK